MSRKHLELQGIDATPSSRGRQRDGSAVRVRTAQGLLCASMDLMEPRIARVERVLDLAALATGAKTIAVGCPFCSTMITDATRSKGAEEVEVIDVASVLLRAVKPL